MPYATRDDVFLLALAAPAFVALARPFDDVDPSSGIIRIKAHGFSDQDLLTLECPSGGTMPGNLNALQVYRARPLSGDLFQIASMDGELIDYFVDAGLGWAVNVDMCRRLDVNLKERAGFIDDHLTAHQPPIPPDEKGEYPPVLVGMNARLAARQTMNSAEFMNAAYKTAFDRLFAGEQADSQVLKDWKEGKPIQPRPIDANAVPDNAARASAGRPPIQWLRESL